jgi:hypothetical protein
MSDDNSIISLAGPVDLIDGKLTLIIPLEYGAGLVECSRGIGEVRDGELVIVIQDWLAEKLAIVEGSVVVVDNRNGKFNLTRKLDMVH